MLLGLAFSTSHDVGGSKAGKVSENGAAFLVSRTPMCIHALRTVKRAWFTGLCLRAHLVQNRIISQRKDASASIMLYAFLDASCFLKGKVMLQPGGNPSFFRFQHFSCGMTD